MEIITQYNGYGNIEIEIPYDTISCLIDLFIPQRETHQSYSFFSILEPKAIIFNNGFESGIAYLKDNKIIISGNINYDLIFFK